MTSFPLEGEQLTGEARVVLVGAFLDVSTPAAAPDAGQAEDQEDDV